MTGEIAKSIIRQTPRQCVVIAAYYVGQRQSKGYLARNLLARSDRDLRVIPITQRNNVAELRASPEFKSACRNLHLVGYDLPRWASWWAQTTGSAR